VRTWAIRGAPGPVLAELAAQDDILVVGPSSHGAVVGAVLGSVATYLVTHAPCPVVVVRGVES
jgi:nucleotide-binding universal stress UspA family protein